METKFTGLKTVLRRHSESGRIERLKNWSIAPGGYDLQWEICYLGQPVMQCIAGEITTDFYVLGFTEEDKKQLIQIVKEEYNM